MECSENTWDSTLAIYSATVVQFGRLSPVKMSLWFLTRIGYPIEEPGMTYLADTDPDSALGPLQGAACTYSYVTPNPILLFGFSSSASNLFMTSKTTRNCSSYFFSICSIFSRSSWRLSQNSAKPA